MTDIKALIPLLALVAGVAIGAAIAKYLLVAPGEVTTHTIEFVLKKSAEGGQPKIYAEPEKLDAQPGDVVLFRNLAEQEVTIDFTATDSIGSPLAGLSMFTLGPASDQESFARADVVKENAEEADYKYVVDPNGALEQSPVIRIGPKKPTTRTSAKE